MIEKVLVKIAGLLNDEDIFWGIGGSLLLRFNQIVTEVNDIDIIVSHEDIDKAITLLDSMGIRRTVEEKEEFVSGSFCSYIIDGVTVDVISEFRIQHETGVYHFVFDAGSITNRVKNEGVLLPYTSLEDWFVCYCLMGRHEKVHLLEEYFKENGAKHGELITRALMQDIPIKIKSKIEEVIYETQC